MNLCAVSGQAAVCEDETGAKTELTAPVSDVWELKPPQPKFLSVKLTACPCLTRVLRGCPWRITGFHTVTDC